MIKSIEEKNTSGKVEIDLTGPDGNAFMLLGIANRFAKQLNYTKEELNSLQEDMKSGDYENLINVFEEHFGKYVIMYR